MKMITKLSSTKDIWIWALLFSFSILFFAPFLQAKAKIIHQDRAMFKVKRDIFFLSDLRKEDKKVRFFFCAWPESDFKFFVDKSKMQSNLKLPVSNPQQLQEHKEQLLFFLKLKSYTKEQEISLPKMGLTKKQKNCGSDFSDEELSEALKLELFLQSRFNTDNFWLTSSERRKIERLERRNRQNLSSLVDEAKRRKREQAILAFKQKVNSRISHEFFE